MKFRKGKKVRTLNPATWLLIKQFFIGLGLFCVVGAVLLLVWYGTRLEAFTISKITVEGGQTINRDEIRDTAENILDGTYVRLVPRRFSVFAPLEKIEAAIQQTERIKNVEVELLSNTELSITFAEYTPDTLWCGAEECYFLDETGYAFSVAPELSGGSLLRYHSLGADPALGVRPFSLEDYQTTKEFSQRLAVIGWYVQKIEIDTVRDAFYTLTPSGEIKTTLIDGPEKPFDFLEVLRQSKEFSHLTPASFQYIDLRFGTKVFVNEESLPGVGDSASSSVVTIEGATGSTSIPVQEE